MALLVGRLHRASEAALVVVVVVVVIDSDDAVVAVVAGIEARETMSRASERSMVASTPRTRTRTGQQATEQ